jgi:cytoskeletal protein CcmA (bactofilin family)
MNLNNLTSSFMPEPTTPTSTKNVLANDVDIKGTIKFENELIFDGKIEGEIISDAGSLTIGKNASVHGEVKTKSVVVHGSVTGNISVTERCELKASSQLTGDLKAMRIVIEEGATFIGKSEVTPNKAIKHDRTPTPSSDASRKNQPATAAA